MQTKLIQTKDYLLLIDEEAEILSNDLIERDGNVYKCTIANKVEVIVYEKNRYAGSFPPIECRNIIAYYPLTKEAKELDLPLLPPFEGSFNITKWAKEEHKYNHRNIDELSFILGCEVGYEKSQSKQFTLEDMIKAYDEGCSEKFKRTGEAVLREEFIQSLSTQQLPKEFEPRVYPKYTQYDGFEEDDEIPVMTPMTFTNSEGKQELIGIYKY